MNNKTCGECRFYHPIWEHEGVCTATSDLRKTCDFTSECAIGGVYPKPSVTVFDLITTSPEVLAPCFVEKQPDQWDDNNYAYYSYLTKEWYATEDRAISATVAKLKEVKK